MTEVLPERSEIDPNYKWNAESVYPSAQHWQDEFNRVRAQIDALIAWKGRLGESPAVLLQALTERDEVLVRAYTLSMWATISHSVDARNESAGQQAGQAEGLLSQGQAAAGFFEPELLAIDPAILAKWLEENPGLQVYTHYIENITRKAAHIRSSEVEEVLGFASEPIQALASTHRVLTAADLRFAPAHSQDGVEHPVSESTIDGLLEQSDRSLRSSAYNSYTDAFLAHKHTLANNLLASVKADNFQARCRRYPNALEWALYPDCIPPEVYHNLLAVVESHQPTWHRYFEIRRRALGVDRLAPYDIWAPLTPAAARIPYAQAVEWTCQALAPLGGDYVEAVRRGCQEQRWVDVYPSQGKGGGAFSWGMPGTHPFIVMNYTDDVGSMSTLAHELGHSMHSYLTWKTQPLIYSGYTTFAAEVASNFHQAMLRAHLLETLPDRELQIGLLEEALANYYRYFLIMPALARFEQQLHTAIWNGEGTSASEMNDLMSRLLSASWGPAMQFDPQRAGIGWATFSHLYSAYYVFQYATGISGANALAQRVRAGEAGAAQAYLDFLRSGDSLYALDALKSAGVDLSSPQPVESAFTVLADYIDRLENLLF